MREKKKKKFRTVTLALWRSPPGPLARDEKELYTEDFSRLKMY